LKNNHLNHFKIFLGSVTFSKISLLFAFVPLRLNSPFFPEHYTYKPITMQNLKSTDSPIKSTENILSVDFKSTAKLHKTSKTRCRLTSLSKKTKKINLDQL